MAIANLHRMEPEEAKRALDEANGIMEKALSKEYPEDKPKEKKK